VVSVDVSVNKVVVVTEVPVNTPTGAGCD